jgi:hypothetical protein
LSTPTNAATLEALLLDDSEHQPSSGFPAARALRVLGQSSRETSAVVKAGRPPLGGHEYCDVVLWID